MNLDLNKTQEQELKIVVEKAPLMGLLMQPVVPAVDSPLCGIIAMTLVPVVVLVMCHDRFAAFRKFAQIRSDFAGGKQKWYVCCNTKTGYFCLNCCFNMPICRCEACCEIYAEAPLYHFHGKRKHAVAFFVAACLL